MCEILAVAFPFPQPFRRVLPWALALERLGIAGFGWGVAWADDGRVVGRRSPGRLADEADHAEALAGVVSDRFLVHLRRPSQLTTVGLHDSQPFVSEDAAVAFAHNGRFERAEAMRPGFAGRLRGRADSEVGFRVFERLAREGGGAGPALVDTHRRLAGSANLAALSGDGALTVYAGNPGNAFWRFRLEDASVASTALHSADDALVTRCLPAARDAAPIPPGALPIATAGGAG